MTDDLDRLEDLLDRHGADPAGWPAPERARVEPLLVRSAAARGLLDAERRLEGALCAALGPVPIPPRLQASLASLPAAHPLRSRLLAGWRLAWGASAATLAGAACLGVLVGMSEPPDDPGDDGAQALASLALDPVDLGDAM